MTSIVIVGGGMVGISLALLLDQQNQENNTNWQITLVEKHHLLSIPTNKKTPQPTNFDGRSTALSAGSVEIFEALGHWKTLRPHAEAIKSVHISDAGHFRGLQLKHEDYQLPALGYVIENQRIGDTLNDALKQSNVECLAPAQVRQCKAKKDAYKITIHSENQTIVRETTLLIVADGAFSPLRQQLGIAHKKYDYQQHALISNILLETPHQGIAYERFTENGPIALLPLPSLRSSQHRAALIWTHSNAHPPPQDSEKRLQSLQKLFGYKAGRLLALGKTHSYPLTLIEAKEQIRSNLVIIGNAFHLLHPVAGQGFNLALRDCQQLVKTLKQGKLGSYQQLKTYNERRKIDQLMTINISHMTIKLFSQTHPLAVGIRQLGLSALQYQTDAKSHFAQHMMGKLEHHERRQTT